MHVFVRFFLRHSNFNVEPLCAGSQCFNVVCYIQLANRPGDNSSVLQAGNDRTFIINLQNVRTLVLCTVSSGQALGNVRSTQTG